ncbi:MAG TPA: Spy/CpxP family protein refolding chaperone [Stenomitos sp.]
MNLRSSLLMATAAIALPLGGAWLVQSGTFANAASSTVPTTQVSPLAQTTPTTPADPGQPGGPRRKMDRGKAWMQQLNLTTDQQNRIQTIQDQDRANSEGVRQQAKTASERMRSLLSSNASDSELRQQHQQMQGLFQQLSNQRFDTMLKIRQVLTPEQRAKMAQFKMMHRGRHGGQGGPGESRGPGPRAQGMLIPQVGMY